MTIWSEGKPVEPPDDDGFDKDAQEMLNRDGLEPIEPRPAPRYRTQDMVNIGEYVNRRGELIVAALRNYATHMAHVAVTLTAAFERGQADEAVKAAQAETSVPNDQLRTIADLADHEARRAAKTAFGLAEVIAEAEE